MKDMTDNIENSRIERQNAPSQPEACNFGLQTRLVSSRPEMQLSKAGSAYRAESPHSILDDVRVLSPQTGIFVWAKETIESFVELCWIDELVGDGLGISVAIRRSNRGSIGKGWGSRSGLHWIYYVAGASVRQASGRGVRKDDGELKDGERGLGDSYKYKQATNSGR